MTESELLRKFTRERNFLQIFTAFIAFIPLSLGVDLALLGLQGVTLQFVHAYRGPIGPELDSTIRFLGVQFVGTGLILLWTIPQLEVRAIPFRIISFSFVLGGLTRLISRYTIGAPYLYVSLVNLLEVSNGLILLIWHWRITHMRLLMFPNKDN
jgi:hypothetical protein